jgi:hypothetical protein
MSLLYWGHRATRCPLDQLEGVYVGVALIFREDA